jgi:PAS domain S-box-containing protein
MPWAIVQFALVRTRSARRLILVLTWVAFCILWQSSADAQVKESRRVLIINSLGPLSPAYARVDEEIHTDLDNSPYQVELYHEYLETVLLPDDATQKKIGEFIIQKYQNRKLDLVIAVGLSALRFMNDSHRTFLPDTPVVFCGGIEQFAANIKLDPLFVGTWMVLEPVKTLEVALKLQPGTEHVVVVGGVGKIDRMGEALVRGQFKGYEDRLDINYLTSLKMPELLERLNRLSSNNTIVIYTSFSEDAAGTRFLDATQSLPMVVAAANAPVFVTVDTFVGRGAVGGYVASHVDQGHAAAAIAERILGGEEPQGIPIERATNHYVFDSTVLLRWELNATKLPLGSVVLNRRPTVWQAYKSYIIGGVSLCLVQMLLISVLLWERARRRKAQAVIRESEKRFRLLADTTPSLIWMAGTDKLCTFFNEAWLNFTGRSIDFELGNGWVQGVHPEDLQRRLDTYVRAFDAREKFGVEYRLRRYDGEYRWLVDYGVPRFGPDSTFCGYIGSCVDISDRKSYEESLQALSGRLIHAQEEERSRIARELHDDFSQRLALLGISVGHLWRMLPTSDVEGRARVEEMRNGIKELSSDLHSLSHQLHSSRLEHVGLAAALSGLCKEFSNKYKIEIHFHECDVRMKIPKDVALCLFRVAQEALGNVVKHSQAKNTEIELGANSNGVSLRIADDGKGFAPNDGGGIGLVGMTERLRLVGGRLLVKSELMQGTTILAEVPMFAFPTEGQVRAIAAGGTES